MPSDTKSVPVVFLTVSSPGRALNIYRRVCIDNSLPALSSVRSPLFFAFKQRKSRKPPFFPVKRRLPRHDTDRICSSCRSHVERMVNSCKRPAYGIQRRMYAVA